MPDPERIWVTVRPPDPRRMTMEISVTFNEEEIDILRDRFGKEGLEEKVKKAVIEFFEGFCQPKS